MGKAMGTTAGTDAVSHAERMAAAASARERVTSLRRETACRSVPPPSGRGPRLLLMTSSLGAGHVRAAEAVARAIGTQAPSATVEFLDFWSLLDDQVAQAVRATYLQLVETHPALFDQVYRLDQRTWRAFLERSQPLPELIADVIALVPPLREVDDRAHAHRTRHPSDRLLFRILCRLLATRATAFGHARLARLAMVQSTWQRLTSRLAARVRAFAPDVIVATQMNPAALLSSVRQRTGVRIPTIGVPTDFGLHDFWIQPGIDRYCLAHESIAGGVAPARVSFTGIPLMPAFREPPDSAAARAQLGLDASAPVVLVEGGGLGLGVESVAETLLAQVSGLQLIVVLGGNAHGREALAPLQARFAERLRIFGWTEDMPQLLRASDLVVGKPGGLTVAEALACGRPLFAVHALGGQESFNVRFVESHGAGRLVAEHGIADAVRSILANADALAALQARAWSLGRRDGADRVAGLALDYAGVPTRTKAA